MDLGLIISFLVASVFLSLMPGPDNIFVLVESITKGRRNGIFISVGLCCGVLIHTIAAATGLSLIIQKSALTFSIIKYFGAGYLLLLAYKASKEHITLDVFSAKSGDTQDQQLFSLIRKGFFMNILNPKVSLFFIAFLPQFITTDGFNITMQMIVLGFIFMIQALIVFSLISILSGNLANYINNSRFWQVTKWSKVGILSLLGLSLALSNK